MSEGSSGGVGEGSSGGGREGSSGSVGEGREALVVLVRECNVVNMSMAWLITVRSCVYVNGLIDSCTTLCICQWLA